MTKRRMLQFALPIAAFIAIIAVMASGPLYRSYNREQCVEAYKDARTRGDSARVDLHPYRNERDNRRVKRRCGEIRAIVVSDSLPVIARTR